MRNGDARRPSPVRAFTRAPWEARYGYCRAVRKGPHVWVTGTAPARSDGGVYGRGDPDKQARRCFAVIEQALGELGARMDHVVRTRMFVTDISLADHFGRVHGEVFAGHPPATTMVEVAKLIHPDMLIEIEADAFVDD